MNWYINYDHFRADADNGFYTVGDMGGGRYAVRFADGNIETDHGSLDDGKQRAEMHYLRTCGDYAANRKED
jgi:hypothetical protein